MERTYFDEDDINGNNCPIALTSLGSNYQENIYSILVEAVIKWTEEIQKENSLSRLGNFIEWLTDSADETTIYVIYC